MSGRKFDYEKPRWDLVHWEELQDMVDVLTFGSKKYDDDNWKRVPGAVKRYKAALMRHFVDYTKGELKDPETGKSHLAHMMCCIHFLQWFEKHPDQEIKGEEASQAEKEWVDNAEKMIDSENKQTAEALSTLQVNSSAELPSTTVTMDEIKPVTRPTPSPAAQVIDKNNPMPILEEVE